MKFVPKAVMTGFVNALAILIFMAQLVHFQGAGLGTYLLVAGGLAIIYLFPLVTRVVPAPLIAIIILTVITAVGGNLFPTVADMGELPSTLPVFWLPAVPFTLETLMIVLPYALPLALVGIIESLLTANLLDEMTETKSDKNRESRGQGIGNIVTGFFGGMAGCAMIGQSVINVGSGGRTRLSTLVAGVFLMTLLLVFGDLLNVIPMAALVAVMIMVFDQHLRRRSLRPCSAAVHRNPHHARYRRRGTRYQQPGTRRSRRYRPCRHLRPQGRTNTHRKRVTKARHQDLPGERAGVREQRSAPGCHRPGW